MSELFWTVKARTDLRRLDEWLSTNASSEIAVRTLAQIGERSTQLLDFPNSGPIIKASQRSLRVTGTPYILVYRSRKGGIEILRIPHNRQNWQPPE
jgi:toxin ParE1/3/4